MSKLCLNINSLLIPSSKLLKFLGVNIDNSIKLEVHIKELCRKVSQNIHAFERSRPFLEEQKSKLLFPLIWLFCSKGVNNEINTTHKRTL